MDDLEPRIETWVDDEGMVTVQLCDAGILEHEGKLNPAIAFQPLQALVVAAALIEKAREALDIAADED